MREKPRDKERLQHILDTINKIENFTDGVSEESFNKDAILQYAITKCFEIIGEAAYKITSDLRRQNKNVDWQSIILFRHILVHDYYKVNIEIVWKAIDYLPKLKKEINFILNEMDT